MDHKVTDRSLLFLFENSDNKDIAKEENVHRYAVTCSKL